MTTIKKTEKVKICPGCNKIKFIERDYYKAGKYTQRNCKPCHNALRKKYAVGTIYKKTPTGFFKLTPDKQEGIKKALEENKKLSVIARDYGVKYRTLLKWRADKKAPFNKIDELK
jgi:hypothetical protein